MAIAQRLADTRAEGLAQQDAGMPEALAVTQRVARGTHRYMKRAIAEADEARIKLHRLYPSTKNG
jgi:hypothetical protein